MVVQQTFYRSLSNKIFWSVSNEKNNNNIRGLSLILLEFVQMKYIGRLSTILSESVQMIYIGGLSTVLSKSVQMKKYISEGGQTFYRSLSNEPSRELK